MSNDYREIVAEQLERELDFFIMSKMEKEMERKETWLTVSDIVDVIYAVIDRWKRRAKLELIKGNEHG